MALLNHCPRCGIYLASNRTDVCPKCEKSPSGEDPITEEPAADDHDRAYEEENGLTRCFWCGCQMLSRHAVRVWDWDAGCYVQMCVGCCLKNTKGVGWFWPIFWCFVRRYWIHFLLAVALLLGLWISLR